MAGILRHCQTKGADNGLSRPKRYQEARDPAYSTSWCISAYRTNMHVRDLASNHYLALEHSKIALEPNHT